MLKIQIFTLYIKPEEIPSFGIMSWKNYILVLVIVCLIIAVFLVSGIHLPGSSGNNPEVRSTLIRVTPLPTYPAGNISETVKTPRGTMIINAPVPESLAVMPVYRLNMSDRRSVNINRLSATETSSEKKQIPESAAIALLDNNKVEDLAVKYLQVYHGLPEDAAIWKIEKTGNKIWTLPSVGSWVPLSTDHTRIIYVRKIEGLIVDSWGISQEESGMITDHDYIKIGLLENGDLLYLTERWTRSEYIRDEPVISVTEALERMKQWEKTEDDYGWLYDLEVRTIRQGYFESTGSTSVIEPAWFFSGINKDGYNQTIVVLARKTDSSDLPFYDGSHPDPSLPDEWADSNVYKNWIKENYVNGTISMEQATDIVKKFSGNSHLVIENTSEFYDDPECSGKYFFFPRSPLYNITTNDGIYIVDSKISVVRSVTYPEKLSHNRKNSLEYLEILNISSGYLRDKFGEYSFDYFARNPDITEYPDKFSVRIPVADFGVILVIDKKTGDVISYTNANALPGTIC
jgi:hypothetical protein